MIRAMSFAAVVLLAVFVRANEGVLPPVYSHDLEITCLDSGCIPPFDGLIDEDPNTPGTQYGGPSFWSKELTHVGWSPWEPIPNDGTNTYEAYFAPYVNSWAPSEWEVDPSEVCGGASNILACMCSFVQLTVWRRTYFRDGTTHEEYRQTAFMSGVDTETFTFTAHTKPVRGYEMTVAHVARLHFFGENLMPWSSLQYVGCVRGIARIRPIPTSPRP